MKQKNYFDYYDLPMAFHIDTGLLKRQFLKKSRSTHPDFHTTKSDEEQFEMLKESSYNNKAYNTLRDEDKRMEYILREFNVLSNEGENKVPQEFLIQMMDLNELLMELEFDFEKETFEQATLRLQEIDDNLRNEINPILKNIDLTSAPKAELEVVKNYFLKKKYLLRIHEKLANFAAL